jgi:hypothetical protein
LANQLQRKDNYSHLLNVERGESCCPSGCARTVPSCCFFLRSNPIWYGLLIQEIKNNSLSGMDIYQKKMTGAFNLLTNWKGDPNQQARHMVNAGVAFMNDGAALATPAQQCRECDLSHITCHNCGKTGHYLSDCPSPQKQTGEQLLIAGVASGEFDNEE